MCEVRRLWTDGLGAGTLGPDGERRAAWIISRNIRRGKEALNVVLVGNLEQEDLGESESLLKVIQKRYLRVYECIEALQQIGMKCETLFQGGGMPCAASLCLIGRCRAITVGGLRSRCW